MAISLCSALVLVTLSQAPPLPVAPTDSLATLRGRAAQDSSDAQLWLPAGDADFYAAWYMRFARGLRPDLLVLPLAAWRSDAVLRARLMADLKLGRRGGADAWLAELVRRRPVCVSMAFDRPPETRPRI